MSDRFSDIESVHEELQKVDYLSDEGIASVIYLAEGDWHGGARSTHHGND